MLFYSYIRINNNVMIQQTRVGKMHYHHVPNSTGFYPYTLMRPWLNLSGKWLDKAGFHVGEPILIKVSKNKLVITKLKIETNEFTECEQQHQQPEENQIV